MFVKRLLPLLVLSLVILSSLLPAAMVSAFDNECGSVTTLPATNVGDNSAKLNASVESYVGGQNSLIFVSNTSEELDPLPVGTRSCTLYFQYGTQPGVYTHTTAPITVTSNIQPLSSTVTTLDPCTKYYVRAVLSCPIQENYQPGPGGYLFSILSTGSHSAGMRGLGVGLGADLIERTGDFAYNCPIIYGNVITFTTSGCKMGPLGQGGAGTASGLSTVPSWPKPVEMSNIVVQSAAIATPKVAPGEKVDVTASVTNKGTTNGDARLTLYVNGQEADSQSVVLAAGQTAPVHFYVSMNEPGTYTVQVGSVPAGSFTVDAFANNDFLIYGLIALFTIGIAVVIYMVTRKRTA